jgi:hypothetical protein
MKVSDFLHKNKKTTQVEGEGFAFPPEDDYTPADNKKDTMIKSSRKSFSSYMKTVKK